MKENDWRDKIKRFESNDLSEEESREMEEELNKLEMLQEHMDNEQNIKRDNKGPKLPKRLNLRKAKWKLRLEQVGTIIALFLLFTMLCSVITNLFYNEDRQVAYDDVVKRAYDITNPGITLVSSGGGMSTFFTNDATYTIEKQIGSTSKSIGKLSTRHFFSQLTVDDDFIGNPSYSSQFYPANVEPDHQALKNSWEAMKKIADVSVSNVYISFDQNYGTDEVNKLLKDYDVEVLFYPVNIGSNGENDSIVEPIGFPSEPMWLETDWILESETKEGNSSTASYYAPDFEDGDTKILGEQFLKVLYFISDYSKQTRTLAYSLSPKSISSAINYIEKNGISHYGVVITGPTSEIVKMKGEEWIHAIDIDESAFYNWNQ